MRLWLGAAFTVVSLITAASVYVFVDDSSGRTLQSESADLAAGKTSNLANDLSRVDKLHAGTAKLQNDVLNKLVPGVYQVDDGARKLQSGAVQERWSSSSHCSIPSRS